MEDPTVTTQPKTPAVPVLWQVTAPHVEAWAWDAEGDGRRVLGVTDRREDALAELRRALDGMPLGARGMIRHARLEMSVGGLVYVYGPPVLHARRDTEGVVEEPGLSWT